MCLTCHLQIFIDSKSILFINNHYHQIKNPQDQNIFKNSFLHPNFNNFTLFKIISQDDQNSLFVITKNDTILELDLESMTILNVHKIDACANSMFSDCKEQVFINQISEINLLEQKMIWLCYIIPQHFLASPSLTNCIIQKNKILNTDLRWQKSRYTSDVHSHRTHSIQTRDHIYIGSFVDGYLSILRTQLPNILGQIDSSQDLITPKAEFYFEKDSIFLEKFETEFEVYFLLLEPVSARSQSALECVIPSDQRIVYVTRLIRICKKDKGGISDHNQYNFGTIAKADIVCPIGSGINEFLYTRAVSASWSNEKLYVLFENQKNSPHGKIVCYFDKFAFKIAFDGPIRQPWIVSSSNINDLTWKNPLPNVCQIMDNNMLSEADQLTASSLSVNGLYRKLNILPVTNTPLLNIRNKNPNFIKAFPTGTLDNSTIIVLADNNQLNIYSHSESNELCDIDVYQLLKNEEIFQISGSYLHFKILLIISTNQRVIQLQINNCEKYIYKENCLKDASNICGWDHRTMVCTSLNHRLDPNRWERSACKRHVNDLIWSSPKVCHINDSQISLTCICSYCTDDSMCQSGAKVQIKNCSGTVEIGKWSNWGNWSECSHKTGFKKRKRKCLTQIDCVGNDEEVLPCYDIKRNNFQSGWSQWFSVENTNIYNSFRAKCRVENLKIDPILETREMSCENVCPGNVLKWSKWSDCLPQDVKYRFFNCSSLLQCPSSKIRLQLCEPNPKKVLGQPNEKENSYTTIHLVLVSMVASIVWFFVLIFISIILLRLKLKPQTIEKKRKRSTNRSNQTRFKKDYSESSNHDYLVRGIKSNMYDIMHTDIMSFVRTENIPSTSTSLYSPHSLITDQHPIIDRI